MRDKSAGETSSEQIEAPAAYEPPVIVVLGSLADLTRGPDAAADDTPLGGGVFSVTF